MAQAKHVLFSERTQASCTRYATALLQRLERGSECRQQRGSPASHAHSSNAHQCLLPNQQPGHHATVQKGGGLADTLPGQMRSARQQALRFLDVHYLHQCLQVNKTCLVKLQ